MISSDTGFSRNGASGSGISVAGSQFWTSAGAQVGCDLSAAWLNIFRFRIDLGGEAISDLFDGNRRINAIHLRLIGYGHSAPHTSLPGIDKILVNLPESLIFSRLRRVLFRRLKQAF